MRIYVASTSVELRSYREAAIEILRALDLDVTATELPSASSAGVVERGLEALRGANGLVLVVGHRYGSVATGFDSSMAQLEFEEARRWNLPIFAFYLPDDRVSISDIERDAALRARLAAFRAEVQQWPEATAVRSVAELQSRLAVRMAKWMQSATGEAATSPSVAPDPQAPAIHELRGPGAPIVPAQPIWKGRNFAVDESSCLILGPFKAELTDFHRKIIAPAVEECGLRPRHIADNAGNREIIEDIWDWICSSRIVIVDITGNNPNVLYELGICHTLGRACIIVTQENGDVPFDIKHLRFLRYEPQKRHSFVARLSEMIGTVLAQRAS